MQIQRFLKGVCGLDEATAREMLTRTGISSNWWREMHTITPAEVIEQLTEARLMHHLNDYERVDPSTGRTFGELTPFISTTSGTVLRDAAGRQNIVFDAVYTATLFATDGFRRPGWIFAGYLFTLGRKAVQQEAFAEEVRELNVYTDFLPFQPEGEILAKVHIPAVQLEEAWSLEPDFDPPNPSATGWPQTVTHLDNAGVYVSPEELVNLRGLL